MNRETTTYLIISAHCLKNIDGYGTVRYIKDEVLCQQPLHTRPFDEHSPMLMYHGKIRTAQTLNRRSIMNKLDYKRYNNFRPVMSDEIFLAVSAGGVLYCYYDKYAKDWIMEDYDEMADGEITQRQMDKIKSVLRTFYNALMEDKYTYQYLQHEYLDKIYC